MNPPQNSWLESILLENEQFRQRIAPDKLPQRAPDSRAVITCMDPRINLEAVGIPGFTAEGHGDSAVRIIRTIGGRADHRSLVIGLFLAGIREITVLMHTDCGCCLAHSKIDTIIGNMEKMLPENQLDAFQAMMGDPFDTQLQAWLKTFEDPRQAVQQEVAAIKALPFIPDNIIFHGLLYDVTSGRVEVIVNGYD
ncbi:MAG: hypothetical protein AAF485_10160 [Chloroflexota bacterium]